MRFKRNLAEEPKGFTTKALSAADLLWALGSLCALHHKSFAAELFSAGSSQPHALALANLEPQLTGQAWLFAPEVEATNDQDAKQAAAGVGQLFGFKWFVPELVRPTQGAARRAAGQPSAANCGHGHTSGTTFTVQVNKKDVGKRFNASYMQLPLSPGKHVLSVKPSAMSKTYEHSFKIESNQTQYVEFELPHFCWPTCFRCVPTSPRVRQRRPRRTCKGLKA